MIYKMTIWQTNELSNIHYSFDEIYADRETLKKAFSEMNSEQMFGEVVKENITPDWETDCFSSVVRKKRHWVTEIRTCFVVPRTMDNLRLNGAFSMERNMSLMVAF